MLISFEGLDNCGKTTIVGKLKKYYDGLNILTDFTREFETNIGREIKESSVRLIFASSVPYISFVSFPL